MISLATVVDFECQASSFHFFFFYFFFIFSIVIVWSSLCRMQ